MTCFIAVCEMDKSWMHADRRSKAYELDLGMAWKTLGMDTNASRNVEEDEQKVGMDDNDLGDIGFDPYEFANEICFPEGNTLPSFMYEAKKTLSALGMSYEKIHTCLNDCILYWKDYDDSTNCPTCGVSRWKEGKDSILKEGVPAKVRAAFNGKPEHGMPPESLNGEEVLHMVEDINYIWGSKNGESVGENDEEIKFFDLEYWKYLHVRHVLDVMHIEKNVCDSIIGTLLEIPGKNKDGIAAWLDLLNMGVKTDLQPEHGQRRTRLPPGPWNLSRAKKKAVCNSFYGMKVPKDSRLLGLKFHDCHTFMQQLLPVAIHYVLEKPVSWSAFKPEDGSCKAIIRLHSSLVDRDLLNQAHLYVLEYTGEVLPYIEEHMIHIKTTYQKFRKRIKWLQDKHNSTFIQWFHFKVQSELNGEEHNGVSENLRLASNWSKHGSPII
ncbi:hypothetical protein Prudu_009280 [Prunus dulcis]|uniref:Uncharacterized protein n=1 Tax=Prunus dulcis TaxID=3755 RepID=A0A4Y1R678_PRUDU|nr:hypothetical protein Prudu_009280 [Prunus dulcis]